MNNFDDLFEQRPQKETVPRKPEPQAEKPKKQWWQVKEEKQRKEAYATLDGVFGAFSEGRGDMKAYLDTQSRFPFHSARNAILIGQQYPAAQRVGGRKEWESQGIEVLEDEKRLPIIILEPGKAYRREDGSVGQNFYAKEVYDISQTTARDEAQPPVESGSAGKAEVEKLGYSFTEVKDQATALMEVAAGTADAAVIDSLMAGAMVGEGTGYDSLTYTVSLNAEEGEQYGVGFRPGSDLAQALNDFFAASYADGSMVECAETYGIQAALIAQ